MINDGFNISFSDFFTFSPVTSTRGHDYKLFKTRASCRSRHNFFTMRVINNWNGLPNNIVNSSSVNALKNLLDNFCNDSLYNMDNHLCTCN